MSTMTPNQRETLNVIDQITGEPFAVEGNSADGSIKTTTTVTIPTVTERYDTSNSPIIYTGSATVGTSDASLGWTITKYDVTISSAMSGKIATDVSWDNRAIGAYN